MKVKEFENYLIALPEDEHNKLVQERIQRLNPEQQKIVQAREVERLKFRKLISKMSDTDPDVQEIIFDSIRDMTRDECEHGRSYCKHCSECADMDHTMFPELFDEFGESIKDSE